MRRRKSYSTELGKSGFETYLLDHLVGSGEYGLRNLKAESLGSFEIDDKLELRWENNWPDPLPTDRYLTGK